MITLIKNQQRREETEAQKDRPFGMDCALENGIFHVSLCGRVDTITAPELLKKWEAEKASQEISAVEIDCAKLDYISSAGLRVLLIMQKSSENGVTVRNINETVKEILAQTGFDSIFLCDQ